ANFTRLPATSRYCIAFRTGAAAVAALAGLTIDTGDLSPAFDPKVFNYSTTAPPGTTAASLDFIPGPMLSSVSIQGVPVALDWSRGAARNNAHTVTRLTPGWNIIAVEVTAPNGFSLTSYTVDVFVASPCPKGHPKKPPAAACLLSLSPDVGPVTGGTRVALQFPAGQLPVSGNCWWCSPNYNRFQPAINAKNPVCNFGGRKVTAEYENWSSTSIVCYAPPWDGAAAVDVTFSLDGTTFSAAGGRFFYHAPYSPGNLTTAPSTLRVATQFDAIVPLTGPSFPSSYKNFAALPAQCRISYMGTTAALYIPPSGNSTTPSLRCRPVLWSYMSPGTYNLDVSINGFDFVPVPQPITFLPRDSSANEMSYTWFQSPGSKLLPATDAYCVGYDISPEADNATLYNLGLGRLDMKPAYSADVHFYSASAPYDARVLEVAAAPAAAGATVVVNGRALAGMCANGKFGNNVITVPVLYSGVQTFTVEVTALNEINRAVYTISVDVAPEPPSVPCPRGYAPQPPGFACLQSLSRGFGPTAGGTGVVLRFPWGQAPPALGNWMYGQQSAGPTKPPVCSFGDSRVVGSYFGDGIFCNAPALVAGSGSQTVPVTFSLDGVKFSTSGANFTYYSPFSATSFDPPLGSVSTGSIFEATILLDKLVYLDNAVDAAAVSSSASCNCDGVTTPATYLPPGGNRSQPALRCNTMATSAGNLYLRVSLNGFDYVTVQTPINVLPSDGAWQSPNRYEPTAAARMLAPGLCVGYAAGPGTADASLRGLELSPGATMLPSFAGSVLFYTAQVGWDVRQVNFTVVPNVVGATVSINGAPLGVSCAGGAIAGNVFSAPVLFTGLNRFTIVVTALNGFSQATYQVDVYAAAAPVAAACQRPYAAQPVTACLRSVTPGLGPVSGGTQVRLQFPPNQLPLGPATWYNQWTFGTGVKRPVCRFGALTTVGTYGSDGVSITCAAPAWPDKFRPETVPVSFSLDGSTFAELGATYTYHSVFQAGPVLGLPSPAYTGYPLPVVVPLTGLIFPANFSTTDLLTTSAECTLQGGGGPAATYLPSHNDSTGPALSCTVLVPWYYPDFYWQTSWTLAVASTAKNSFPCNNQSASRVPTSRSTTDGTI
ncbi:hypothetical protein KFL_004350010, partial [Klebsormidium nitens]